MDMGTCPILTQPPQTLVSEEVSNRVLMLEANTGRHLPDVVLPELAAQTLTTVNRFFFEHAVLDENVAGWQGYKLRLKDRTINAVTQNTINWRFTNMERAARAYSRAVAEYAVLMNRHRIHVESEHAAFSSELLQPVVNAGYTIKEINNDSVQLVTPTIIINHAGYRFNMGRYRVKLAAGTIRVVQHSGGASANGYRHPHVSSDGSVCWGTGHAAYIDYLASGNPVEALLALLQILRTYNSTSPYKKIGYWIGKALGANVAVPKEIRYVRLAPILDRLLGEGETFELLGEATTGMLLYECEDLTNVVLVKTREGQLVLREVSNEGSDTTRDT